MRANQFQIIDLSRKNESLFQQAAELLMTGFAHSAPSAWPTMPAALEEAEEALETGKIARVAVDADGVVLGWIGGMPTHRGRAWELHPLVVHP
ncbi:MAG: hypothetical protein KDE50_36495, partial [Caldilineaceae bacterium]|nr:hypothetical protein [Caldilineaceae bacterium]